MYHCEHASIEILPSELALYGPKLIRSVGTENTHLDKTRVFV